MWKHFHRRESDKKSLAQSNGRAGNMHSTRRHLLTHSSKRRQTSIQSTLYRVKRSGHLKNCSPDENFTRSLFTRSRMTVHERQQVRLIFVWNSIESFEIAGWWETRSRCEETGERGQQQCAAAKMPPSILISNRSRLYRTIYCQLKDREGQHEGQLAERCLLDKDYEIRSW